MNKIFKRTLSLTLLLALIIVAPASAAKPVGGGTQTTPLGNDISFPQCGRRLPSSHAFGIVGLNGGKATTQNPCFGTQLKWAHAAKGGTTQPKAQIYVNTANPGEVREQITTWPSSKTATNPYAGDCNPTSTNGLYTYGDNNLPCSWQYGWDRAIDDVEKFFIPDATAANVDADPTHYVWWLDVETMNTWQSGSPDALARNAAALEGMVAAFHSKGIKSVGIYSTGYQWGVIVGNQVKPDSNLNYTVNWLAGGGNQSGAQTLCSKPALTLGSTVTLTQFVSKNLDYNVSCKG